MSQRRAATVRSSARAARVSRTPASCWVTSWLRTGLSAAISSSASRHHCRRISAIIGSSVTQGARLTSMLKA
jgi:pyrrolidone-carboxylate peptidase